MTTEPKRGRGRPPLEDGDGRCFTLTVRLGGEERVGLDWLMSTWNTTQSGVIRRLLSSTCDTCENVCPSDSDGCTCVVWGSHCNRDDFCSRWSPRR